MQSQKLRNVLKRIFEFEFFLAIFSFCGMIDFIFNIRSKLGTWEIFESENLTQKRKPGIPENQLTRRIQSKSIRGLWGGAPIKTGGIGGRIPPNIKIFMNSSSPEYATKVKYKIDHNSKTNNRTKNNIHELKNSS